MKLLLAAAAAAGVSAMQAREHPIAGVISMLKKLGVQAMEEGEAEEIAFTKYSHWCGNEIDSLKTKKASLEELEVSLKEKIAGEKATIESLEKQIEELTTELSDRAAVQEKADEMREKENKLYKTNKDDLELTIKAVQDALKGLQDSKPALIKQKALVKKAAVIAASAMTAKAHKTIQAFLQQPVDRPEEGSVNGDQKKHEAGYTFKSGSVIELLKSLEADFKVQLVDTEKAETNSVNGFDLAKQANDAAITAAEESKKAKEDAKDSATKTKEDAEAELDTTVESLKTTNKNLKDTTTTCTTFQSEYETRTSVREAEQTAIKTAIDVLAKATGLRESGHAVASRPSDFIQISAPKDQAMKKAISMIADAGKRAHNGMVQRLAEQLKVLAGRKQMPGSQTPFAQINNMIQKMIFRLNKEQTDEDAHKAWCDKEMDKTDTQQLEKETQRDELTEKVNKLTATIEKTESTISDLTDDLSALAKYVKEETDLRAENKAENEKTISDSKEAIAALKQATAVLTEFYKGSGKLSSESFEDTWTAPNQAGAFIQVAKKAYQPADPFAMGEAFTSTGEEKVMELLSTVTEDYVKNLGLAQTTEAEEEANFKTDMDDKRIEKAQLEEDVSQNEMKLKRKTEENNKTKKMLKSTKKQLEAIMIYQKDLEPSCKNGTSSHEDRKAARAAEVEALKSALETLKEAFNQDVAETLLQKKSFMARRH